MFAVWKKYGPFAIGVIVLMVIGTLAYDWWQRSEASAQGDVGSAMIAASSLEDPVDAAEAFMAVADEGKFGYAPLARLRAAASFAEAGESERAAVERLAPLTGIGNPWRSTALEFEAAAHLRASDQDAALASLDTLISDPNISPQTSLRVRQMRDAIGVLAGVSSDNAVGTSEDSHSEQPTKDLTTTETAPADISAGDAENN